MVTACRKILLNEKETDLKKKILMITLVAAAMLTACAKRAEQKAADGVFTPNQGTKAITEETTKIEVESESADQMIKVNVSPELKAEAEEYASYVEMQEDKIGILSRKLMECSSYSEYESLADQILTIANEVKDYPVPEDNEELKSITASAMDEIITGIEDSLEKARENLP